MKSKAKTNRRGQTKCFRNCAGAPGNRVLKKGYKYLKGGEIVNVGTGNVLRAKRTKKKAKK